jgi:hypothetical protein
MIAASCACQEAGNAAVQTQIAGISQPAVELQALQGLHMPSYTLKHAHCACWCAALHVVVACLQVNAEGVFRYAYIPWFAQALQVLALSGVHGVAVDVWVSVVPS